VGFLSLTSRGPLARADHPFLVLICRFLLTQGNDEAAIRVIYDIAKFNNALVPSLTIEDFRALDKSVEAEGDVDEDTGDDEKREGKGGPLADFFVSGQLFVKLPKIQKLTLKHFRSCL
jgi:hypothetical protein